MVGTDGGRGGHGVDGAVLGHPMAGRSGVGTLPAGPSGDGGWPAGSGCGIGLGTGGHPGTGCRGPGRGPVRTLALRPFPPPAAHEMQYLRAKGASTTTTPAGEP